MIVIQSIFLASCSLPRVNIVPVVKVGLVAPFEGPYRAIAYESLFAVKLALKEHNDMNHTAGPLVELVALNDNFQPADAKRQALQMVMDPAVLGVVGPWMGKSIKLNNEIYQETDLSILYPFSLNNEEVSFSESRSEWTYNTTTALLLAIREAHLESNLTRQGVKEKLKSLKLIQSD